MELISRTEAQSQSLTRYFTGKHCKHGHVSDRQVSNKHCCECLSIRSTAWGAANKERRAATNAAWQAANKERISVTTAAWTAANKERKAATNAAWAAANKGRRAATSAAWIAANKERKAATVAAWREANKERITAAAAAWREANKERITAAIKAHKAANPELAAAASAQRRAAKLQATPAWADRVAIKKIYEDCAAITRLLGEPHHVDHIYPLQSDWVCGLHVAANLQILTAKENITKSNKFIPQYV